MPTGEVPIGTINTLKLAENDIITHIQADFFQPVGRKIISYNFFKPCKGRRKFQTDFFIKWEGRKFKTDFFSSIGKEESFRQIFFIKWEGRKFQTDSLNGDTFRQVF